MRKKQNDIFFMEIFDNILKINDSEIAIIYDTDGEVWFGLRDVIIALGYNDVSHAVNYLRISDENKNLINVNNIKINYNKYKLPQCL